MSKRREQNRAKGEAVAALGKGLSRRAKSKCELCEQGGPLSVQVVEGGPKEPTEEWALLLCGRCAAREGDANELRFLENAMWSELLPAQLVAIRWLQALTKDPDHWAGEVLENLYISDEVKALV